VSRPPVPAVQVVAPAAAPPPPHMSQGDLSFTVSVLL
jgi:hypothetical protein